MSNNDNNFSDNYRDKFYHHLNKLNKFPPLWDKVISTFIWLACFSIWTPVAMGTFIAISTLAPYIRDLTTEQITIFDTFTATAANLMVLFFGFAAEFGSLFLQFLIEIRKRELAKLEEDGIGDEKFVKRDVNATIKQSNICLMVFFAGHFAIMWVYVAFNFASEPASATALDPSSSIFVDPTAGSGGSDSPYIMIPQNLIEWILITLMSSLASAASMYAMPYILTIASFNLIRAYSRN